MRGRVQLGLFLAAWAIYDIARWVWAGELGPATDNAHRIMDLEHATGTAVEHSVQQALDAGWTTWLLSNIYLAAQLAVVPGALFFLYKRSPGVYRRLRDTILATWMLSVPIFALFPCAPPRLAGIGMADTVSDQAGVALTGHSTVFYNPLAAVPSLHCGFAFAIGIALAAAARTPWTKALALMWGPVVALSVVATGNHYVFDIAAGLLVSVAGYVVGTRASRLLAERPLRLRRPTFGPNVAEAPA
jgi:membrane-associated phospholipid phosphatase